MTKKHFKALAEAISKVTIYDQRERLALEIGKVCHEMNPRFNWSLWNEACKVKL